LSQRRTTLAKISYQRFFRRYLRLSGMTGTATEVRREFWSVYGLPTVRIPTHRPVIRSTLSCRVHPTLAAKWQAVIARVERVHQQGRPVLIGTRSVAASEQLSQLMHKAGLHHQVLNARHDAAEAQMVARAGLAATITIATNMAGRGTDIKLGAGVPESGGLHVILTERHEAARIDRQLAGRCGRQGDPGSYEEIVSWEDPLLDEAPGTSWIKRLQHLPIPYLAQWAIKLAQNNMESFHGRLRKELFLQDQQQSDLLSFSGRQE
jgi:preprotein translocase subunit SecA